MLAVEQRLAPRCSLASMAGAAEGEGTRPHYALDLSRTGMRFVRLHTPADDTPAIRTLAVPLRGTGRVVHALAETLRVRPLGPVEEVAVRFRYLSPEDQRCLDAYLSARDSPGRSRAREARA